MESGKLIRLDNVELKDYTYKLMPNNTEEERIEYLLQNEICHGFNQDGEMKFYIDPDRIAKAEGKYLIVHKERNDERTNTNSKTRIPKRIHFVFLSKGKPFGILYYIAMKSALHHNGDYEIYLHTDAEPNFTNNVYLQKLRDDITVNIMDEPTYLNGNRINSFQHKADYIRLNALKNLGGIYLDLDIILLKPLDHFLNNRFVMGYQGSEYENYICNAVIMCEPDSIIINEWIEIYNQSWGESYVSSWMGHSVVIPAMLRNKYADIMTIYSPKTFYPFLWNDLSILYNKDNGQTYENSYAVHLWDTEASKTNLLPDGLNYFATKKNTFTRLFGYLVNDLYDMNNTLNIDVNAKYGLNNIDGKDVTNELLKNFRFCDRIFIPANAHFNDYFGDPCENIEKKLFIVINGEEYTIGENRTIDISLDLF